MSSSSSAPQHRNSRSQHSFFLNKRHKSGRSKTARHRQKKSWAQFSRWNVDDFSDEDSEFLHFCQTRGLSRTITAPPLQQTQTTSDVKQAQLKKGATKKELISERTKLENPRFIARLCSSLLDKNKFIREAEGSKDKDNTLDKLQNRSVPIKLPIDQKKSEPIENISDAKSNQRRSPKSESTLSVFTAKTDATPEQQAQATDCEEKNDEAQVRAFPEIAIKNENDSVKHSASSITSINKLDSTSHHLRELSKSGPPRRLAREWTAEVENDILRLYESGGPRATWTSLDSKPQPRGLADVKEQVEAKVSTADRTPSYVIALANLFRRRMQIRKEFNQVSGDMTDTSLQGSSIPTLYSNNNVQQLSAKEGGNTSVAFRYHHVSVENSAGTASTLSNYLNIEGKPDVAHISSPSPILNLAKYQDAINFIPNETTDTEQRGNTMLSNESNSGKQTESAANVVISYKHKSPFLTEETKSPKEEKIKELLTVLPKPPQYKFSGIQKVTDLNSGSNNLGTKVINSRVREQRLQKENWKEPTNSSEVLVMSFTTAQFPKSRKPVVSEMLQFDRRDHKRNHILMRSSNSRRQCSSAAQTLYKTFNGTSPVTSVVQQAAMGTNNLQSSNKTNLVLFDKSLPLDNDVNLTFVPMSKVHWSGSLGTLYSKPRTLPESKFDQHSTDSKMVIDKLATTFEKETPHRIVQNKELNQEIKTKTDLMTISPLEKRNAITSSQ